jgi:imidazolonepropionase-like amidohydrolase
MRTAVSCNLLGILVAIGLPGAACVKNTAPAAPAATERRHSVLMMGNRAGEQVARQVGEREWLVTYTYSDRGRGPSCTTRIVLGPGASPTRVERVEIRGHDYMKAPVDEHFVHEGGQASWRNAAESGERSLTGDAFYVSIDGPPEELGLLARALLESKDGTLALLPGGQATIATVGEPAGSIVVRDAKGRTRNVTQYAITGLGFSPQRVWLDEERRFFASVSSWMSVIEAGFEPAVDELVAAQEQATAALQRQWAETLTERPRGALVFRDVRVFDSVSMTTRPGMTVVVKGDRIAAVTEEQVNLGELIEVGPDGTAASPQHVTMINGGGKTLLPGLWDMHVHVGDDDGLLNIAAGVTTVRDLANDTDTVLAYQRDQKAGHIIFPRIVLAGFMDGPGPYAGPTRVLVDSEAEARAAIDRYAELGFEQIKVYSSIRPELVPAIVAHAHARGLRVSGHVPAFMRASQAVMAGFDELQHINFLVLELLFDQVQDTRTPVRFTAVAEHAAGLDLGGPEAQAFIALLAERDVVVDPTVSIFEGMFLGRPGEMSPVYADVAGRMPVHVQRVLSRGALPVTAENASRYQASFEALLRYIGMLHRAGVRLVAGTDALAGFALHRELENYVRAGIPAPEVLRIATLGAAQVTGRDGELGVIAPGKLADLVLVDGDPTTRISDIRNVVLTVQGGRVYHADALHRVLGIAPR